MKFNFEKKGPGEHKKSVTEHYASIALRGGLVLTMFIASLNSLDAQTRNTALLYNELLKRGLVTMSEEAFGKLSKDEMDVYFDIYVKARQTESPDGKFFTKADDAKEAYAPGSKFETISTTNFVLVEVDTKTVNTGNEKPFDFNQWFRNQMELVSQGKLREGDSVQAPNGKFYKIAKDPNYKPVTNNSSANSSASQPQPQSQTITTRRVVGLGDRQKN